MQPRNPLISTKSLFQLMPDSDSKTKPETRATSQGEKKLLQTSSNTTGGNQNLSKNNVKLFQTAPTLYKVESSINLNNS